MASRYLSFFFKRGLTTHGSPKLSYLCGTSKEPLLGTTIGHQFEITINKSPDREAVVFPFENIRKTFSELSKDVNKLASGLLNLGLRPGDRLGIWGPNSYNWLVTQFAAAKSGIILVNINPAYRHHELEYAVHKVGVRAIISAESFKTLNYLNMLHKVYPEMLDKSCKKKYARAPNLEWIILMSQEESPGTILFDEIASNGEKTHDKLDRYAREVQMDDIVNIQFTSGTTGDPKAAALTHHNVANNIRLVGIRCGLHVGDWTCVVPVPFYHCSGYGSNVQIILQNSVRNIYPSAAFDAESVLKAIHGEKCNSIMAVPTMFLDILNHPNFNKYDTSSMITGVIGGSPCPIELMHRIINDLHMKNVTIAYGTTENSPVTFQVLTDDNVERKTQTIGIPMPHTEVKIVDPQTGCIVPIGEIGEICTRGYCVMLGYYGDDEKTREVIDQSRWYHTGDLGKLDEHGYGYVCGRIKEMVIRGGENIYPAEVENLLLKHSKIAIAQVVGVPDERMGEELCAAILLKSGIELTSELEKDIRDFCLEHITYFKIPRYFVFVKEFPMTVTNKVQKYILREQMIDTLKLT